MLSKKKAAKRAAISATAHKERHVHRLVGQHRPQQPRQIGAATSSTSPESDYFVNEASRTVLSSADAVPMGSGAGSRADVIRQLGDHINTRVQEVTFQDDLDGDVFHERRAQLMEEARLAAGVKQREVSTPMRAYLGDHTAQRDLFSVRVAHNCNSITCVAALGTDCVVYGDKSGRVYMVDIASPAQEVALAASLGTGAAPQQQQRHRKTLLEPPMPSGVVSIAVSDTSANRPTTRDLFEKTTVDMSCPSYVAAGAKDGSISVWETLTKVHKGLLLMHRKPITGLRFRMDTATLYSCCADGTLRVWSVPQMMSLDKLFGHEGPVHFLDTLRKETAATVGEDGTMRFWKMDAATQQAYHYLPARLTDGTETADRNPSTPAAPHVVLTAVAMLNESIIVAGAMDGAVVVFDLNRRKPIVVEAAAHGYGFIGDGTGLEKAAVQLAEEQTRDEEEQQQEQNCPGSALSASARHRRNPNPITAVAAVPYADVVATASYDGVVRIWHLANVGSGATAPGRRTEDVNDGDTASPGTRRVPTLRLVAELPVPAIVNALRFSDSGDILYVAMAKEPRRGRWVVQSSARNGVLVVPLTAAGRGRLRGMAGEVEHLPAQLYGITEAAESFDDDDDHNREPETLSQEGAEDEAVELTSSGDLHADGNATATAAAEDDGILDMFDVSPDGMLRFRKATSRATATAVQRSGKAKLKATKKSKNSGMPKILRRGAGVADTPASGGVAAPTAQRDAAVSKKKKVKSAVSLKEGGKILRKKKIRNG